MNYKEVENKLNQLKEDYKNANNEYNEKYDHFVSLPYFSEDREKARKEVNSIDENIRTLELNINQYEKYKSDIEMKCRIIGGVKDE